MNKQDIKEGFDKAVKFLSQKKVYLTIIAILLILIIAGSSYIRTTNISSLKDATTGEYLTADLDAFYFLRIAETIIETGGNLPQYDLMRYPSLNLPFSSELLPSALVFLFKILSPFSDNLTLRFVDVIYPVIFFALSMILFFFLVLKLTKSKTAALLSSFFLAIIPAYLFRTMAGVSDHEPLGMFAFFLVLLSFIISVEKTEKKKFLKVPIISGIITGFLTTFCIVAWGGVSKFVLLIFPLTVLILWLSKCRDRENKNLLKRYLLFYSAWVISFICLGFVFSYPIKDILIPLFRLQALIVPLFLIFFIIDYSLFFVKNNFIRKLEKYKVLVSLVLSIVALILIGLIFNSQMGISISGIISSIIRPFGGGRVGSTVAENAFPYLSDLMTDIGGKLMYAKTTLIGGIMFWLFFVGTILLGINFSKGFEKKKDRIYFSVFWAVMICGILFHRVSASKLSAEGIKFIGSISKIFLFAFGASLVAIWFLISDRIKKSNIKNIIRIVGGILSLALFFIFLIKSINNNGGLFLNGGNFISKLFYVGSIFLFLISFVVIYFRNNFRAKASETTLLLYTFFMCLAGITAVRLEFILTPIVCIMTVYAVVKIWEYAKKVKEDLLKVLLYAGIIVVGILLIFSSITYVKTIKASAVKIGASSNVQWQYAMNWVRENTPEDAIFVHWWDYGYWVQYLGERATITDGGHGNDYWDHLIGRYLLTTSNPNSALSFMKTQNVSYLLIDPTDIGKYAAYSSIGSDENTNDRYSYIITMLSDSSQIQETKNGTARIYNGGFAIDEDIEYEGNGEKIMLASESTGLGAIIVQEENNEFLQPIAAFIYNNQQINIPLRYLYYNGELYDFESGIEAGVYMMPYVKEVGTGIQVDNIGALMYLSPRTINSLISKLYLMNDPLNEYSGVVLAHSEPDYLESIIELYSGQELNEFYYFGGLRGPLKIWEINPPENILVIEEFAEISGEYAQLDDAVFVK